MDRVVLVLPTGVVGNILDNYRKTRNSCGDLNRAVRVVGPKQHT